MTEVHTTLPPALERALALLIDPPAEPDVSKGYLRSRLRHRIAGSRGGTRRAGLGRRHLRADAGARGAR
jgi:hypothetical protein